MNGVPFVAVGALLAALAAFFWKLRAVQADHAADRVRWQEQEATARKNREDLEDQFDDLSSTLATFYRFGTSSAENLDFAGWAETFLSNAASVTGADQGAVLYPNKITQILAPIASRGLKPETLSSLQLKPGEGPLGRAAQLATSSYFEVSPENALALSSPLLLWPVQLQDRVSALLLLGGMPKKPTSAQQARLGLLVQQANLVLANLELSGSVSRSYHDLVQTLARSVDARDAYTHQHSDRTRAMVRAMGEECLIPSQLIRVIEYGGLLHDLGKIGIDDAILRKPGKLTPEEYDVMKQHPAIGYRILQPVSFLRASASIVLYHQEWFNGQGYPEGLAGQEIPLGARMISVIDAWDAMTSNRPYRKAMPKAAAIAELRRQAGTQFDPKMVDAFVRVQDKLERAGVSTTETQSSESTPSENLAGA